MTALACAGLNTRPAEAASVPNEEPSVLPCRESVSVRVSHPEGSLSTIRSTLRVAPRSTCTHWGKEPAGPSQ